MKACLGEAVTRFHQQLWSQRASKAAAKAQMGNESVWRRVVSVPSQPLSYTPQGPRCSHTPHRHPP